MVIIAAGALPDAIVTDIFSGGIFAVLDIGGSRVNGGRLTRCGGNIVLPVRLEGVACIESRSARIRYHTVDRDENLLLAVIRNYVITNVDSIRRR